jgi:hypothetical protein
MIFSVDLRELARRHTHDLSSAPIRSNARASIVIDQARESPRSSSSKKSERAREIWPIQGANFGSRFLIPASDPPTTIAADRRAICPFQGARFLSRSGSQIEMAQLTTRDPQHGEHDAERRDHRRVLHELNVHTVDPFNSCGDASSVPVSW